LDSSATLLLDLKRSRFPRLLAMGLVGLGLLLAAVSSGYLFYSWIADRDLDKLIYKPTEGSLSGSALVVPEAPATLQQLRGTAPPASIAAVTSSDSPAITSSVASPDPVSQRLFPGESLSFQYWADLWAAEPVPPVDDPTALGFLPIDPATLGAVGSLPSATRISIPAIGLEADINELAILDLGDYKAYETPNNVVGHIPGSANSGEAGNNWLFGHLESLIRGEGSIFRNLPKIPDLLRRGERVYITLETPLGEYLYEASETDLIHKSELTLYPSDQAQVTLVTCYPRFKYDKRLLVTANLVGFKPAAG